MLSLNQFKEMELRVGTIVAARRAPGTDKLLCLSVDLGEEHPRQIISGIADFFEPDALIGQQYIFVANLAPRTIRGFESQGMILAAGGGDTVPFALMQPTATVPPGSLLT